MTEFAGKLNSRVELWQPSSPEIGAGSPEDGWEFVGTCLAFLEADGAASPSEAMAYSAMPKWRLTVRPHLPFAIDMQIRWQGRRLVIRQLVENPQQLDRVVLRCEELR